MRPLWLPLRAGSLAVIVGMGVVPESLRLPAAHAQPLGGVSLSRAQVQCVVNQIDAFLDEPDDPVIIYLDLCLSTPDQNMKAMAGSTRVDIPSVPRPRKEDRPKPPPSITLSKAALQCLKTASATPDFPTTDPVKLTETCPQVGAAP